MSSLRNIYSQALWDPASYRDGGEVISENGNVFGQDRMGSNVLLRPKPTDASKRGKYPPEFSFCKFLGIRPTFFVGILDHYV